MVQSVGAVVIGHFSVDGALKRDHFNRTLGRCITNMFIVEEISSNGPPVGLMTQIVEILTYPGQTVVDTTCNGIIKYTTHIQT